MNLKEIYSKKDIRHNGIFQWVKPVISFEVFPPKENEQEFYKEIELLKNYNPEFISLTCGAGGKNNDSADVLKTLKNDLHLNIMPHFTCINNSKESVSSNLKLIEDLGIENILALRGDEPQELEKCYNDFHHANELVAFIKEQTNLSIGVAGYPEGHIDSPDIFSDIDNLKRKIDAGADAIFTQLFFNNDKFFSYIQLVRDAGIEVPIIAGIMPILSYKQITKMTHLANISVPKTLQDKIEQYKDNSQSMKELGIDFASYQCQQLIDAEVAGLHFFTLNKSYSTIQILDNII